MAFHLGIASLVDLFTWQTFTEYLPTLCWWGCVESGQRIHPHLGLEHILIAWPCFLSSLNLGRGGVYIHLCKYLIIFIINISVCSKLTHIKFSHAANISLGLCAKQHTQHSERKALSSSLLCSWEKYHVAMYKEHFRAQMREGKMRMCILHVWY